MTLHALSCVKDGLEYFQQKFGDDSKSPLNAFKAAQYVSPSKMDEMQPSASDFFFFFFLYIIFHVHDYDKGCTNSKYNANTSEHPRYTRKLIK